MTSDRVESTYRRVHERLWRALVSFTGDVGIASDAESEAFAQVLARGEAVEDVERWVWRTSFRIARGMLADRPLLAIATDRADEHVPFSAAEFIDQLAALSDQQRACIVLRHVAQMTPADIADLLDTTPTTVSVQLNRANSALRAAHEAERKETP